MYCSSMRLPMKPSQTPDDHRGLADLLRELHHGGEHVRRRSCSPRTTSSSFITLAGLKKCVPSTSCGRLRERGDRVRRRASRCWWRGSRPACTTSSSLRNTCSLTSMSSNTASMTRSASRDVVVGERRLRAAPCRFDRVRRRACPSSPTPRSSCGSSRRPGRAPPASSRASVTGNAGVQEVHRDAAAHRAGADDRDALDRRASACRPATSAILRGRALGEERVAQRARFRRLHELARTARARAAALRRTACSPRPRPRRRTSAAPGRPFATAATDVARELEEGLGVRIVDLRCRARASAARFSATTLRANASAPLEQVAVDDLVEQRACRAARRPAPAAPDTIMLSAVSTPTTRGRRCVPPAPGSRPSFTSGSAICASRRRDAVVAAERELEAAAHADAADRRDHRLGARLDDADQRAQRRLGRRLRRVELADVGAAGERLAGADDHDRASTCGSALARSSPATIAAAHGVPQAVDRRIVERDDGDAAVRFVVGVDDRGPSERRPLSSRQTSSHSLRTAALSRSACAVPSNTIRPWPIT